MVSRVLRAPCMERVPKSNNIALDARFLGASVAVSHDTAKTLQQMDPVFFQAAHPNGTFLFCALLAYPENSDDKYVYQVNISWPYKRGFLGRDDPIEVPKMQEERHFLMREMANYWEPPFRDIIDSMPGSLELQEIKLEYRIPEQNSWNNMKGRATLIGDAAHPMPPYRGEACNHAIKDVVQFVTCYSMVLNPLSECPDSGSACFKYEKEMILRTQEAVLASVLACKHAHDYRSIDAKSPLVSARAVVALRDVQSMLDGPPLMRPLTSFKAIS